MDKKNHDEDKSGKNETNELNENKEVDEDDLRHDELKCCKCNEKSTRYSDTNLDFCILCHKLFCSNCSPFKTENGLTYILCDFCVDYPNTSFLKAIGLDNCTKHECVKRIKDTFFNQVTLDYSQYYHCYICHCVDSYASFEKCKHCKRFIDLRCCTTYRNQTTHESYSLCNKCNKDCTDNEDPYYYDTHDYKTTHDCYACQTKLNLRDFTSFISCRSKKNLHYYYCLKCKPNIPPEHEIVAHTDYFTKEE